MHKATLLLIICGGEVLLAKKKRGEIGAETLNGPGGKIEPGETAEECAVRETLEELDIDVYSDLLEKIGHLLFFAGGVLDLDVQVFKTSEFSGELCETAEVELPRWYPLDAVPYDQMLESDRVWMRKALAGERFKACIYYRERAKGFERIEFFRPDF